MDSKHKAAVMERLQSANAILADKGHEEKLKWEKLDEKCFTPIHEIMTQCGYDGLLPGFLRSKFDPKTSLTKLKKQPAHCLGMSNDDFKTKVDDLFTNEPCKGSERFDTQRENKTIIHGKSSDVLREIPYTSGLLRQIRRYRDQIVENFNAKYALRKKPERVRNLERIANFVKDIHIDRDSAYILYHPTPQIKIHYEWSTIHELLDLLAQLKVVAKAF